MIRFCHLNHTTIVTPANIEQHRGMNDRKLITQRNS